MNIVSCEKVVAGICLVKQAAASTTFQSSLFAFPQFMTALALLAVVYTVTDVRYRFRLAVAPVPLYRLTFIVLAAIGLATLATDIWLREGWLIPESLLSASMWEAIWAVLFLTLALTWIWYGFLHPPRFERRNSYRYASALYHTILKGSDSELPVIADELGRSAEFLVAMSKLDRPRFPPTAEAPQESVPIAKSLRERLRTLVYRGKPPPDQCAHQILLMIGNRKFCRHIVASAPATAISLFNAAGKREAPGLPLGQFAKNACAEAIINKDSILYHEDEGYESGYFGYVKPFSEALFGNFELVERLGDRFGSPLDVAYASTRRWDAEQVEIYARAVLITTKSYLRSRRDLYSHSFALARAFHCLQSISSDAYMIDPSKEDATTKDTLRRFEMAVNFAANAVVAIDEEKGLDLGKWRIRKPDLMCQGFCDNIADLMFEFVFLAATIKSRDGFDFSVWHVQHNIVWSKFLGFTTGTGAAELAIAFKLRRLLYDEICRLEKMPNYKSARILGLCLFVGGLDSAKSNIEKHYRAIKKCALNWTRKHYLRLLRVQPEVAAACLVGSVSYDSENRRLVKTYSKGLELDVPREYLELNPDLDDKS
jgi:hypothetical protein